MLQYRSRCFRKCPEMCVGLWVSSLLTQVGWGQAGTAQGCALHMGLYGQHLTVGISVDPDLRHPIVPGFFFIKSFMSQILVCLEAEPEGGPQDTKIKDSAWPPCSHQCSCKYRLLLPHADKAALVPVLTQILLPQTIWNQLQIRYWFFTHTNRCPGWEHSLTETFHPHKVSSWWQFKENRKSYPIHYILWH